MEITLEKIELVKDRTGVSYREAKEALEAVEGNVVDAIIKIEDEINAKVGSKISDNGAKVVEKIKDYVKKGNVARITVKKDDEIILNVPVTVGVVGTVLAPWLTVIGSIVALGLKYEIILVKDDGTIVDLTSKMNETVDEVKEKGEEVADTVRSKATEAASKVKDATEQAADNMEEIKDIVKDAAHDIKDTISSEKANAGTSADEVKDIVKDAAHDVKDTISSEKTSAGTSADEVKDIVKDAAHDIKDTVSSKKKG